MENALGTTHVFLVTRSKRKSLKTSRSPERVELMKVLSEEQAAMLTPKKQKHHKPFRELDDGGRGLSVERRRRLASQGIRGAKVGDQHVPGDVLSVELTRCGHRARVEALSSGWLPQRAKCPTCRRWQNTMPLTARKPERRGTGFVVGERFEERDGRVFTVKVLETPRRARFRTPQRAMKHRPGPEGGNTK